MPHPIMSLPIAIAGMHRSGTSLTASFAGAVGVNLGENLFRADCFNTKGYFEDVDFLEFQRSLLQECCPPGELGWPDWGWTESESLDRSKFENYREAAQEIIARRRDRESIWGWKDPRTSLMLDFWSQLLPDARFILVYRYPWDVADSIVRINGGIFSQRPDFALKIWTFYNRHLLEFYRQHPDRCILLSINGFAREPRRLLELMETKLGLQVSANWESEQFQKIYDPALLRALAETHPLVRLLKKMVPECVAGLEELDRVADIKSIPDLAPGNYKDDDKEPLEELPLEELPLEGLVLLLYRQAIAARTQLESLAGQAHQEKLALTSEIERLEREVASLKSSQPKILRKIISFLTKRLTNLL